MHPCVLTRFPKARGRQTRPIKHPVGAPRATATRSRAIRYSSAASGSTGLLLRAARVAWTWISVRNTSDPATRITAATVFSCVASRNKRCLRALRNGSLYPSRAYPNKAAFTLPYGSKSRAGRKIHCSSTPAKGATSSVELQPAAGGGDGLHGPAGRNYSAQFSASCRPHCGSAVAPPCPRAGGNPVRTIHHCSNDFLLQRSHAGTLQPSPAGISSRFCSPQNERNPSLSGRATEMSSVRAPSGTPTGPPLPQLDGTALRPRRPHVPWTGETCVSLRQPRPYSSHRSLSRASSSEDSSFERAFYRFTKKQGGLLHAANLPVSKSSFSKFNYPR